MKSTTITTATDFIGQIETPYGVQMINRGQALDHMQMRGQSLTSLLTLMQGDGAERFGNLGRDVQESLLWLAVQMAEEMETMVDILLADSREGRV
jgi:hypothetical protein